MRHLVLASAVLLFLAACSSAPKPYTEIHLQKIADFDYAGQDEAFARTNLLAKQGKELPKSSTRRQERDFCHEYSPRCSAQNSWACTCIVFDYEKQTFVAADMGDHSYRNLEEYKWSFFDGKNALFSAPMEYGADGPIQKVEIVDGKPAVSFRRALELPASDKELTKSTFDIFYNGIFFNEHFVVESSHDVFMYEGKIGFIGGENGKEYIYFDGKPVSRPFDVIRTSSCCAVPMTQLRVFDNGALVFTGERGGYAYLTEIDLNSAIAP